MDGARRPGRRRFVAIVAIALVLLSAAPEGAAATPPSMGAGPVAPAVPVVGISAVVRWDGTSIASATSSNAALVTSFSHTIDVNFTWVARDGITGPNLYNISTARLQFFYFGVALDTRDVVDSTPTPATNGWFDMPWQPGVFQYLFEGTFGLTASLIAPNGTTMWSQAFFIHAQAPASILAVLPILLVLIGVYEGYGLAVSGRQAATTAAAGRKPESTPASEGDGDKSTGEGSGGPPH